ncbi:uncharacterized protein LOC112568470 [Pomacea canaliculata]|uniref:uncharacterized protein LOC112568470 n=1 Tax=Pomacea canaliculata TaxID=400727 RepID=UPI000D72B4A2|nr:uncharacterized protein LOC112568470 [Pomacea canaliculata]
MHKIIHLRLVFLFPVRGAHAPCTQEELSIFLQCILPYNRKFSRKFGTGGSCNRTLITDDVCNDFSDIVICANQKNITSSTCRPRIGVQIEDMLAISCKVTDFKELCSKAPALDVGRAAGASGVGISLRLLGAVIIVSLIAHM